MRSAVYGACVGEGSDRCAVGDCREIPECAQMLQSYFQFRDVFVFARALQLPLKCFGERLTGGFETRFDSHETDGFELNAKHIFCGWYVPLQLNVKTIGIATSAAWYLFSRK